MMRSPCWRSAANNSWRAVTSRPHGSCCNARPRRGAPAPLWTLARPTIQWCWVNGPYVGSKRTLPWHEPGTKRRGSSALQKQLTASSCWRTSIRSSALRLFQVQPLQTCSANLFAIRRNTFRIDGCYKLAKCLIEIVLIGYIRSELTNFRHVIVKAKPTEVSITNETRVAVNLPDMCASFWSTQIGRAHV